MCFVLSGGFVDHYNVDLRFTSHLPSGESSRWGGMDPIFFYHYNRMYFISSFSRSSVKFGCNSRLQQNIYTDKCYIRRELTTSKLWAKRFADWAVQGSVVRACKSELNCVVASFAAFLVMLRHLATYVRKESESSVVAAVQTPFSSPLEGPSHILGLPVFFGVIKLV